MTDAAAPLSLAARALREAPWRDPREVIAALGEQPWSACLLSDGGPGARWSYVAAEPDLTATATSGQDWEGALRRLSGLAAPTEPDGPPFQGGVLGLAAYELGSDLPRDPDWPDLALARYPAVLAFDHHTRGTIAIGRGPDLAMAAAARDRALAWLAAPARPERHGPLADRFAAEAPPEAYEAAVADVVARIGAGEIFQANIARAWRGRLASGVAPIDLFARLARDSAAPFAAYWRLPGRALVSNSPEQFLGVDAGRRIVARPIKGTRPRAADPAADANLAAELAASGKDRAENLMIVDLMRNDLARVCVPGTVAVPELFAVERFANVHHLVSTVAGTLRPDVGPAEVLAATFPPGSITGAPKVQAMKVIAGHERPRGPWCGALFAAGTDGALQASVLIRTLGLVEADGGWRFRTLAGAGIVADSVPAAELAETGAKIAAIAAALGGEAS